MFAAAAVFSACGGQIASERGPTNTSSGGTAFTEMAPGEAAAAMAGKDIQFIDVRTPEEYAAGHADRAVNIPLDTITQSLDRLEKNDPVYVICRTSNRSREAAKILNTSGFGKVIVITGGMNDWEAAGMPMVNIGASGEYDQKGMLDEKTRGALIGALNDERRSRSMYQAMSEKLGGARPFSNIVEAERVHEERLMPLFEKYKIPIPENSFVPAKMPVPDTRVEACKAGIESEKKNIVMYEEFLGFVKEKDIVEVFKYLQAASQNNHLPAFTRCADGGGQGNGPGRMGGPPRN